MTIRPDVARAVALGAAAPPMVDGEPVFAEPWEGRAYGLALETVDRLGLDWEEFRSRLITAIAESPDRPYYESWVVALERLVVDQQATSDDELADERRESATYHYAEGGGEIEVTPLLGVRVTNDAEILAWLGDRRPGHVELYERPGRNGAERGIRAFAPDGEPIGDRPLGELEWMAIRDRAVGLG